MGSAGCSWPLELAGKTSSTSQPYSLPGTCRKTRLEPLRQVGAVVAPDDELAMAYARATYDEERWVEMMIVPKAAVIQLWAPGEAEA